MCENKSRLDQDVLENTRADSMNTKQLGVHLYNVHAIVIVYARCTYDMSNEKPQHKNQCTRHILFAFVESSYIYPQSLSMRTCTMICMHSKGSDRTRLSVASGQEKTRWWLMSWCKCSLNTHRNSVDDGNVFFFLPLFLFRRKTC